MKHYLFSLIIFTVFTLCQKYDELDTKFKTREEKENLVVESLLNNLTYFLQDLENEKNTFLNNFSGHKDSLLCKGCQWVTKNFYGLVSKTYHRIGLFNLLSFICDKFVHLSQAACDGYINNYGHVILDSLMDHYMTPEYICTKLSICKNIHYQLLDADDYAKNLLIDKPKTIKKSTINNSATTWKMLHVTDIHTDTQYIEGSVGNCIDPFCCRKDSQADKSQSVKLSGKWGFLGKCDLPVNTLISFVDSVAQEIQPDLIIWTGDNPSHAEWEQDTSKEILTVSNIFTNLLKEKFGNKTMIYPSLGNHEKFPVDQFYPFDSQKEKPLLKFFADIWKDWLGEDAYDTFLNFGYYSKKHLDTNLRIISYNCLYCDVLNFYLIKNPTDPNNQIQWLEKTLRQAEKNGEVVYLIGHISAADTSMLTECAKRFKAITDRFSNIILGQFAGHTHLDEIKVMNEYFDSSKISGIVYIAPSLTTY